MASPAPVGARILAGVGAIVMAYGFGVATPVSFLRQGYDLTAYVAIATVIPLVAFLGLLALAPAALQAMLKRVSRVDLRDVGHVAAVVVMAGTLYFVVGYGSLVGGAYAYESEIVAGEEPVALSGDALLTAAAFNLVILVLPAFFFVGFVGGGGPRATLRALGLRSDGNVRAIAWGVISTLVVFLVLLAAGYLMDAGGVSVPENERAMDIALALTPLGAVALAALAAVSEEVFFRGFLQPRVGLFGQAAIFAIAHLSYLHVMQIVVVFVLAFVFGLIYRRTGNLAAPITAHFLFNLVMLLAAMYAPTVT